MESDYYTPVDNFQIPTGELAKVKGTPFDFNREKTIGEDFKKVDGGYDHNYVINKKPDELKWFARVEDPSTGRTLEVATTQPGVQLYTSNFLNNVNGKNGKVYSYQDAFCLETQHFPDSPNRPEFPSTLLKPGEEFNETTIYRFGVVNND
jgi:aldose 1-epimerase